MVSHRCPHPAVGQITWPTTWPTPAGAHASVDVCDSSRCHTAAHQLVETITGNRGQYVPYPVKPRTRRRKTCTRTTRAMPGKRPSTTEAVAVPWDVLGALLTTAPAEVEEWAEQQLGIHIVVQAVNATPGRFQELIA